MRAWGIIGVSALLWCLLSASRAHAVPAFARREGVTCQMCHFRMPELNEDGHQYLRRGLREEPGGKMGAMAGTTGETMPMGEPSAKTPAAATPRPLGEPLLLQWGDYLTVMGHHMFVDETGHGAKFDAGMLDIWAAGPLDRHWSGLANPAFNIEEGGTEIGDVYGQYITHWNARFDSARFGRLLPLAILLNQGGPSLTLSTPVVLSTAPDTGSPWTPTTQLHGVEVGAVNLPRWNAYLGAAQPDLNDSTADRRHTDVYASADYLFTPRGDSLTAYGYWGGVSLAPGEANRSFHRAGLFANIYGPRTKGVAGYLTGKDEAADGRDLDNTGYFVLAEHLLSERWAAYARYDHFRQDLSAGGPRTIHGPALGASWWAQTQVRLTAEAQFLDSSDEGQDRTFMVEFLWAF